MDVVGAFRMFDVGEPYLGSTRAEEDGVKCPSCGFEYTKAGTPYAKPVDGHGGLTCIPFVGECGHKWELCFDFHEGNTSAFIRIVVGIPELEEQEEEAPFDYRAYLRSDEWKDRAEQEKERAGQRCEACNTSRDTTVLDTHHRTYERLGAEAPGDLIVLCRACHGLFHKNGRLAKAPK